MGQPARLQSARLTVTPDAVHVMPGETVILALRLQNGGDTTMHYHIDVTGIPRDWYELARSHLLLHPARDEQVHLTVHLPASITTTAKSYDLTVQVTDEDHPGVIASATVTLATGRSSWLDMDVSPEDVVGARATFHLTFLNQSSRPAPVALDVRGPDDRLNLRVNSVGPVLVPACGLAGPITVQVIPKVRAMVGGRHTYQIEFRGRLLARVDTPMPELVRRARFTYVPLALPLHRALGSLRLVLLAYAAAIAAAEVMAACGAVVLATLCHAVLVLALLSHYAWIGHVPHRQALLVLMLVPLLRILSVTMPTTQVPPLYWSVLIGLPLLLAAALMIRRLGAPWLGRGVRSWSAQCLVACSGVPLGAVAFVLVHPGPLIPTFNGRDLAVAAVILSIFVGFTEELIFRGMLQQVATDVFGSAGLLWSTTIYVSLYIGSLSFAYVLFVGVVSLFFAWCVQRTGSLWGVVGAHSGLAVGTTCIWPFLLH